MSSSRKSFLGLSAALLGLTVLAYVPVFRCDFIWDDDQYVTRNPTLRSWQGLDDIWTAPTATPQYYPLVHTTFWLEYHLWGLNPVGYHVTNVALQGLNAVLVWMVLKQLSVPGAWFAAAVFAVHPVHVESVAWVTERKNVLSGAFYLAALGAYLRFEDLREPTHSTPKFDGKSYSAAFFLYVCALLSKTVTVTLPAALLLIIWWKRGALRIRDFWPLLPFFLVGAPFGFRTAWLEKHHVGASGPEWDLAFVDRVLIASRALWHYAASIFWPARLTFIYPRWSIDAHDPGQWRYLSGCLVVVAVLWWARKRVGRGPLTAVLFFAGSLFPALGFFDVYPMRYTFVADHFQYLASLGLIVLAASGLTHAFRTIPVSRSVGAGSILAVLALLTAHQCGAYRNLESIWADTVRKNPEGWMAWYNLGMVYASKQRFDEARGCFQRSVECKPDLEDGHINLGNALSELGRLDEADAHYRRAIELNPRLAAAYTNRGAALVRAGEDSKAVEVLLHAEFLDPGSALVYRYLGLAYEHLGRTDEAVVSFRMAVGLSAGDIVSHARLGRILVSRGETADGNRHLEASRVRPPDSWERGWLENDFRAPKLPPND